ncbi:MAG: outer membrane beta-barrel protein [Xanthobacteraceae bacterium]|nr:outer membrane beta-barrel protein [Xanthobacteraceae bacterium]
MRPLHVAKLVAVFVVGFASLASAADLAVKAPAYKAPVVAPVPSWTGFYLGLQAGYGWESDPTYNYTSTMMMMVDPSVSFGTHGFVGGGTGGYNWQTGAVVLGVEGDISYADVKGSALTANTAPCYIEGCTAKLSWFGTGRVRLGYAAGDFLPYVTGGAAVGEIKGSADLGACRFTTTCGFDDTRWGWTAGGGLEYRFYMNWSAKVEYLYMDLGTPSFNVPNLTSSRFTYNIVRGGVNLHF